MLLRQPGAVELSLQPWPTSVGLAQTGDEAIDYCHLLASGGEVAHLRQAPSRGSVVPRVGLDELARRHMRSGRDLRVEV